MKIQKIYCWILIILITTPLIVINQTTPASSLSNLTTTRIDTITLTCSFFVGGTNTRVAQVSIPFESEIVRITAEMKDTPAGTGAQECDGNLFNREYLNCHIDRGECGIGWARVRNLEVFPDPLDVGMTIVRTAFINEKHDVSRIGRLIVEYKELHPQVGDLVVLFSQKKVMNATGLSVGSIDSCDATRIIQVEIPLDAIYIDAVAQVKNRTWDPGGHPCAADLGSIEFFNCPIADVDCPIGWFRVKDLEDVTDLSSGRRFIRASFVNEKHDNSRTGLLSVIYRIPCTETCKKGSGGRYITPEG